MTLQDTHSAIRRPSRDALKPGSVPLRMAAALVLLAALAFVATSADLPDTRSASGEDWHGNVAASGYRR